MNCIVKPYRPYWQSDCGVREIICLFWLIFILLPKQNGGVWGSWKNTALSKCSALEKKEEEKNIVWYRKQQHCQCAVIIITNPLLLSALCMEDPSQTEQFLPGNGKTQWCWYTSRAEHTFSNNVLFSICLYILYTGLCMQSLFVLFFSSLFASLK